MDVASAGSDAGLLPPPCSLSLAPPRCSRAPSALPSPPLPPPCHLSAAPWSADFLSSCAPSPPELSRASPDASRSRFPACWPGMTSGPARAVATLLVELLTAAGRVADEAPVAGADDADADDRARRLRPLARWREWSRPKACIRADHRPEIPISSPLRPQPSPPTISATAKARTLPSSFRARSPLPHHSRCSLLGAMGGTSFSVPLAFATPRCSDKGVAADSMCVVGGDDRVCWPRSAPGGQTAVLLP
jgi:hypothetical protein